MNRISVFSVKISVSVRAKCFSTEHNLITSLLNMRRNDKTSQELKEIRLKIKEKSSKYVPGTVTLQVLGSGAWGAPQSLYLFTDQTRYLFNVGEGCQRLAHEHKMKLSKLEHIFITEPKWANIGGLPGVALTIQDVGVPEITLHGPPGTSDLFPATRRFVVLNDLKIRMADCNSDNTFEDNVMTVKYAPILASVTENMDHLDGIQLQDDDVHYYSRCKEKPDDRVVLPKERVPPIVMCYICKLKPKAGMLNLEACVERGVRPGPLLGRLKNGEDVTLPDGTVVLSADVTDPEQPGPVVLVVDCPTEDFLDGLTNSPVLNNLEDSPHAIVHFTPPEIQQNEIYQTWRAKYPTAIHLNINKSNSCTGSIAVHRIQHQLNMIHPTIFPLLNSAVGGAGVGTMTSLHLRPVMPYDPESGLKINPDEYTNEPFNDETFKKRLTRFRDEGATVDHNGGDYPRVAFLGTGSCIPNKTRNTSGILIHMSDSDSVLLDCGEATFSQILRLYGQQKGGKILKNLKMIYVSHLHADHHIGLIGLLTGRRQLLGPSATPVYLLAPQQILAWLQFYHIRFEGILPLFRLISNADLKAGCARNLSPHILAMLADLGLSNMATVFVRHCPNAYGVALTHKNGWKITYSGDTMPCDDLVSLGYLSDLLIHEATMEDELEDEARVKYHSTTSQAIQVGRAMNAKFTLLTHFSQRYAKLPRLPDGLADNVGIAFDNMQVSLNQLPVLTKMLPVLQLMFAEHVDEMDAKALRRNFRKQLKRSASPVPLKSAKVNK